MDAFTKSTLLLFVLLNPFTMSVYLFELVRKLGFRRFADQMIRAAIISFVIFVLFAWAGETVFEDVMQVRFLSFLIFGGIVFLIVGIRLILGIGPPVEVMNPSSGDVSASIALPFIVGPGTLSASVLAGTRLELPAATAAIAVALVLAIGSMLIIKFLHDHVRARREDLIERYTEIAGRVTALFIGSFAIEMILTGIERWLDVFQS